MARMGCCSHYRGLECAPQPVAVASGVCLAAGDYSGGDDNDNDYSNENIKEVVQITCVLPLLPPGFAALVVVVGEIYNFCL